MVAIHIVYCQVCGHPDLRHYVYCAKEEVHYGSCEECDCLGFVSDDG